MPQAVFFNQQYLVEQHEATLGKILLPLMVLAESPAYIADH